MNLLALTGNLGGDCKTNSVSGTAVANFSVAMKSGWGDKEQSIWLDCALWGRQAESGLVDYLVKGQQVALTGELGSREHDGKTYLTLRVSTIDLVGGKQEGQQPRQSPRQSPPQQQRPSQQPAPQQQNSAVDDYDDDIPF